MITLLPERLNIRLKVWGEINIIVLWNMVIQKKNIGQTLGNFENESSNTANSLCRNLETVNFRPGMPETWLSTLQGIQLTQDRKLRGLDF